MGRLSFLFKKPRLTFNKSSHGVNGFAFHFKEKHNSVIRFNNFKIRHFNPFGEPTQQECIKDFVPKSGPFAMDLEVGEIIKKISQAKGAEASTVQIEISSTLDGRCYQYDFKWKKFCTKCKNV